MRKTIALVLLSAALLTGCAESRLSSEETCSELDTILALGEGGATDTEVNNNVGDNLTALAEKASDPLTEDVAFVAEVSSGTHGSMGELSNKPELMERYEKTLSRLGGACDIESLKEF